MKYIARQFIPISLDEAWAFFSDPSNLEMLTPAKMRFRITSGNPGKKMYPGMIITYIVSPLLRIPMNWMTEITQVKEKEYFIDDQKSGPFKIWHHQHHFKEVDGGVEMTDIINYKVGFGFIGGIANALFVKRRVRKIFEFRQKVMERLFTDSGISSNIQ